MPHFTTLTGADLIGNPLINKGTAFTHDERVQFNLLGLLPPHVESLNDQVGRAYKAFSSKTNCLHANRWPGMRDFQRNL
jgi:hypothetical protein